MNSYQGLMARIKAVRRRWRFQALIKGLSLFLVATIALLILGVWGADLFGFRPFAVWAMRVLTGGAAIFIAWRFLYIPLTIRITDVQIAQYIEERYPQLEDRLITAIEFGRGEAASSGMVDLLIRNALDHTNRVDFSVFINRKRLLNYGLLGTAACLVLLALFTWGPSFFPYGFNQLYVPWTNASFGSSMMIKVNPGNVEIAKGSDQQVKAQLVGFDAADVRLYVQPESSTVWKPMPMEPEARGNGFLYLLIDIQTPLRYYVESKGVRSLAYSVKVFDQARVANLSLTYNFPAYTGMPPQTVENEGDISALKGTRVNLKVSLSQPARTARLLFDDQSTLDLSSQNSRDFSGSLDLKRSGSYVVQIAEVGNKPYSGSPEYLMEALEDAPPKVTISKPMRDVRATSVEEVFSEVKAEDEIGMGKVELRYSVNGGPEKSLELYNGNPKEMAVTAAHTFFLEEYGLQPGDIISYYGKGWDNNNVTGPGTSSTDIYFIEVRPFEQKYTQSQQAPSQSASAAQSESEQALSKQQKEIISATFKQIRDKEQLDQKEYLDNLKSLALVQSRLQEQAKGVVSRMERRGAAAADESFGKLAEYLSGAIAEMEKAAINLGAQQPSDALPEEQKSLQQLMRAESLFREIQVSFAAQQSSSGSSGSQANAEDLADLFELELNKLKNQYETVQRGEQQAQDQQVDEALQRLKELAQRQQQMNERNRQMAQRGGSPSSSSGGGGGNQSQQQLMQEAEQLQRQLQRLSRERSSPQLSEISNQLQKAIDEMKKGLASQQSGNSSEAMSQGIRALQQLDEAQRHLAQNQQLGLQQELERAAEESQKLVEEQAKIQENLERISQDPQALGSQELQRQSQNLVERKTVLAERVKSLGSNIEGLNRLARRDQPETSDRLTDAAGTIRDRRLADRIMAGNQMIESGNFEAQLPREDYVSDGLERLGEQMQAAKNSLGQSAEGKIEEAVNRTRELAQGLQSMQQRMQNLRRNGQAPGNQQGQQGQQGQRGQGGGQGQQGQRGQQGGLQGDQRAQGQRMPQNNAQGRPGDNLPEISGNSGALTGAGGFRNEDERQLSREIQQRLMDAESLRDLLDRNSTQTQNLDRVIESVSKAGLDYNNPERIDSLRGAIDLLHQVETDLGRQLDQLTQKDKYFFAEDNEAPDSYQKLVDEYYKAIAKGQPKQ